MAQLTLFELPKIVEPKKEYVFRSYGEILNSKIWPELTLHQRINIRAHNAGGSVSRTAPNYMYLTLAIRNGLDKTPHPMYSSDFECFYMLSLTNKLQNK